VVAEHAVVVGHAQRLVVEDDDGLQCQTDRNVLPTSLLNVGPFLLGLGTL